jgi:hypothetical protein
MNTRLKRKSSKLSNKCKMLNRRNCGSLLLVVCVMCAISVKLVHAVNIALVLTREIISCSGAYVRDVDPSQQEEVCSRGVTVL